MREIILSSSDYTGSGSLYWEGYLVSDDRQINGTNLETYDPSHWTQYANALTLDTGTGEYFADFPTDLENGNYFISIHIRSGGTPATNDEVIAEGEYPHTQNSDVDFPIQLQNDSDVFFQEFAEQVVYNQNESHLQIPAIVDRNSQIKTEDGYVMADYIEVSIPQNRVSTIQVGQDSIRVSGRFGGVPTDHVVTAVVDSDPAVWRLRIR